MPRNAPTLTWMRSAPIRKPRSTRRPQALMDDEPPRQGMLGTDIPIMRKWINPAKLPDEMAISAVTLAELSAARTRSAAMTSMTSTTNATGAPVVPSRPCP